VSDHLTGGWEDRNNEEPSICKSQLVEVVTSIEPRGVGVEVDCSPEECNVRVRGPELDPRRVTGGKMSVPAANYSRKVVCAERKFEMTGSTETGAERVLCILINDGQERSQPCRPQ